MINSRTGFLFVLIALAFAALVAPASARTESITHGGSYYGTNVVVGSDQQIEGNISVYGGDAIVEGRVDGDVTSYGGSVDAENGGVITGNVNQYGTSWASWMPFGPSAGLAAQNRKVLTRLAYSIIVVLAFLIFPLRVRKALDRIEHHPGLSAATGVMALVAIVPLAIILIISVIGLPLVPVEFIAIFAGILIGQAALGILIGRRLFELVVPRATPSPLAALIIGLVVLSAAEILPAVGGLLTGLVCLVGLGAAVLAFIRETAFLGSPAPARAAPGTGPRPPIGGPPMTTG
ncbi:MAG: hypothetical protein ABR508_11880 [Candidatus Baltobacteraceae bacterium]